jgi:hypothetical protein
LFTDKAAAQSVAAFLLTVPKRSAIGDDGEWIRSISVAPLCGGRHRVKYQH